MYVSFKMLDKVIDILDMLLKFADSFRAESIICLCLRVQLNITDSIQLLNIITID